MGEWRMGDQKLFAGFLCAAVLRGRRGEPPPPRVESFEDDRLPRRLGGVRWRRLLHLQRAFSNPAGKALSGTGAATAPR